MLNRMTTAEMKYIAGKVSARHAIVSFGQPPIRTDGISIAAVPAAALYRFIADIAPVSSMITPPTAIRAPRMFTATVDHQHFIIFSDVSHTRNTVCGPNMRNTPVIR